MLILNSDLEYAKTFNAMMHQWDIVAGVSWK